MTTSTTRKTYLVTGATGFLGRHVLTVLSEQGYQVLALVRNKRQWDELDWVHDLKNVNVLLGDVTDPAALALGLNNQNIDGIFHLAALVRHSRDDAEEVYNINVDGTLNVVKLAASLKCRVVFVSTSGTVGCFKNKDEAVDESAPYLEKTVAKWPYYDSKVKAEKRARQLASELGVELVIVRPPVMLGPGDHKFRSTGHIIRAMSGRLPFLLKGGIHFIDIRDASLAIVKAMMCEQPQPVYHLKGANIDIGDFFGMVEKASGAKPPKLFLPNKMAWSLSQTTKKIERVFTKDKKPFLPDPVVIEMASKYWGIDSKYSHKDLDYKSRDPQDTIQDTVNWLRKNHKDLKDR